MIFVLRDAELLQCIRDHVDGVAIRIRARGYAIEVVHLVLKRAEGRRLELRTVDSDIESLSPLQS